MARRLLVSALILLTTACSTAVPGRPVAGSAPPAEPIPTVACEYPLVTEGPLRRVSPPDEGQVPAGGTLTVRVDSNHGRIDVELDAESAPCSVHSFRHLIKQQLYKSSRCHRLTVEGIWMIQCGDPTDTGAGGPGYVYDDPTAKTGDYTRGVVAMANAGPGTNGSQFFIIYQDSPLIGPDFPVIGRVTRGMEVIDQVAEAGLADGTDIPQGGGKPATSLVFLVVEPA
ncbi:peptidyl-prolyl cis-trans isomerase B (cyclophilin B) [Saccharothrix ecbatanensis]|uniref:Peptidyl-prolyl cis-trans isomerase n=1 Tax=Saccharothrix ecbatanensis TaxID=1105145 RepID=A0A7W9LY72_9PSEU|nr:peptidylprolyl isomerase [Saccharothrix ecbatanensis]MBB5800575.1 peptidyl-prolyl cis-trans isomerase B (cyclophilin B) [Saccharothrix ecbatanensis]